MASARPTLTVSTTTYLPGLNQPIIPGLGEPAVSRTAAWYERTYPNARPRAVVPFSAYMVQLPAANAAAPTSTATTAAASSSSAAPSGSSDTVPTTNDATTTPAAADGASSRKDSAQETPAEKAQRGTRALRAMLSDWAAEEADWCRRGTETLRRMLSDWEEEERQRASASATEPFPAFDDRLAFEMLWADHCMGA